ncbi:MAG: peptidoglycan DD-metalloendopeptidase family protein [candidate division Zixibacteria bacterium]|nr:peptidoglycan DD-metalloendopeptidase family protein [candidate division Zixibacteria bacterium]
MKMLAHGSALLLGLLLIIPNWPAAADNTGRDKKLEIIRTKLHDARRQLDSLLASQADIYEQLDKVEETLELSARLQRRHRRQIRQVSAEIPRIKAELKAAQVNLSLSNQVLNQHLRNFYTQTSKPTAGFAFSQKEALEQSRRQYLLTRLLLYDKTQSTLLDARIKEYKQVLVSLSQRQDQLAALSTVKRREEEEARQAMQQREKLLAAAQHRKRQKKKEIAELQEASGLLGDIIAELEDERDNPVWQKERTLAVKMKGKLHWPVRGRIISRFGTKTDRTGLTSKESGIKIATVAGRKVVAALTGEVVYIGWARGLEKFLIVAHGGSIYCLYGNLADIRISEGDQLIRSEPFAETAGDRLHFEIRDGKVPLDPLKWLK